ncbi:MAG: TlpA disulfide reductase family protein [Nitrospinota bacterium]
MRVGVIERVNYRRLAAAIISIPLALALGFFLWGLLTREPPPPLPKPPQLGEVAANFRFPFLDGEVRALSDYRGKVVVVNIWATWCPPCLAEMPSMERLYQKLKGEGFEILGVSVDVMGREVVEPFTRRLKITYPIPLDVRGTIKKLYGITGVPESFILNREGVLVRKVVGAIEWDRPEVLAFFRELLKGPTSPARGAAMPKEGRRVPLGPQ